MRVTALSVAGFLALGIAGISAQSTTTMDGVVSDQHCGAKHNTASAEATKCVEACMKGGADPVLVNRDKIYKIKGEVDAVKALAGQEVTITGTVDGDTITVTSVKKS
jgi:hypothetical protein